jgi:hypothetical protein
MTSDKQLRANRRNALKSTGPKTSEGKSIVKCNALKHGLLAQEVLLPNEDKVALEELGESMRAELQPAGEMENLFVKRIIASTWRLRRLGGVEAGIFAWELYGELVERAQQEACTHERTFLETMVREPEILDERKLREALQQAKELEAKREAETNALGRTFIRDADKTNAFSKLSRCETAIERSLYRALHELQRLQAARHAKARLRHQSPWTWRSPDNRGRNPEIGFVS